MKFHPYADIFPKLSETELRELADDIKAHGQREKIWTYKNQILDGRNRFNACMLAGIKAKFRPFKGTDTEALALVVSANMVRRHLTESQRASAAAKVAGLRHGGDRRSDQAANLPVETQASAAEKFGVSERSVRAAKKVHEKGSKALNDALDAGEVSVSRAASVVDLPKSEQLAAAKSPPPRDPDEPERPDESEDAAALESAERDWRARMDKILASDDRLNAMAQELKQAQDELTAAKQARDRYMNENAALLRQNKALQRKLDRLEKKAA